MVTWPPKKASGSRTCFRPYEAGVEGKSPASTKPWAWLPASSIQLMIWKACSGSRHALVIARKEPPLLAGRTGMSATRHRPLVFGTPVLMSLVAQEAFSWLGSLPYSTADSWSGVPLTRFETILRCLASTASAQAWRTCSWSPMKLRSLSTYRLPPCCTTFSKTLLMSVSREAPGIRWASLSPAAKNFSQVFELPGDVGGLVGQARLLEDGVLVEVRDRAAVDREADHRAVVGDALLPLPGQVTALVPVRAQGAQVHELVGVGQIGRHVLALESRDVGHMGAARHGGDQLGTVVTADLDGPQVDRAVVTGFGVLDDGVAEAAVPVPQHHVAAGGAGRYGAAGRQAAERRAGRAGQARAQQASS